MRLVRVAVGMLLLVLAVPVALAGAGLWVAMRHASADGTFTATLEATRTDGRAIVVTDVDELLRADAPFARGGQTDLSISARGGGGPLFLGLAPYADVERYLADAPRSDLTRVRLARGPLPVDLVPRAGVGVLAEAPVVQGFWLDTSSGLTRDGAVEDALTWSPSSVRGQRLAFVVMNGDGTAGVDVTITAELRPGWLPPTTWGLLILGTAVLLLGALALGWPQPRRDLLYIVEHQPLPEAPEAPIRVPTRATVEAEPAAPPLPPVSLRLSWPSADPTERPPTDPSASPAQPSPVPAKR